MHEENIIININVLSHSVLKTGQNTEIKEYLIIVTRDGDLWSGLTMFQWGKLCI